MFSCLSYNITCSCWAALSASASPSPVMWSSARSTLSFVKRFTAADTAPSVQSYNHTQHQWWPTLANTLSINDDLHLSYIPAPWLIQAAQLYTQHSELNSSCPVNIKIPEKHKEGFYKNVHCSQQRFCKLNHIFLRSGLTMQTRVNILQWAVLLRKRKQSEVELSNV